MSYSGTGAVLSLRRGAAFPGPCLGYVDPRSQRYSSRIPAASLHVAKRASSSLALQGPSDLPAQPARRRCPPHSILDGASAFCQPQGPAQPKACVQSHALAGRGSETFWGPRSFFSTPPCGYPREFVSLGLQGGLGELLGLEMISSREVLSPAFRPGPSWFLSKAVESLVFFLLAV